MSGSLGRPSGLIAFSSASPTARELQKGFTLTPCRRSPPACGGSSSSRGSGSSPSGSATMMPLAASTLIARLRLIPASMTAPRGLRAIWAHNPCPGWQSFSFTALIKRGFMHTPTNGPLICARILVACVPGFPLHNAPFATRCAFQFFKRGLRMIVLPKRIHPWQRKSTLCKRNQRVVLEAAPLREPKNLPNLFACCRRAGQTWPWALKWSRWHPSGFRKGLWGRGEGAGDLTTWYVACYASQRQILSQRPNTRQCCNVRQTRANVGKSADLARATCSKSPRSLRNAETSHAKQTKATTTRD